MKKSKADKRVERAERLMVELLAAWRFSMDCHGFKCPSCRQTLSSFESKTQGQKS